MKLRPLLLLMAFLLPTTVIADDTEAEIGHLIDAVGESGCTFIRNGSSHDADDAAAHLRMKYRRGKRYATTAELFIERLASKSSMSGKPYQIKCPDKDAVTSGEWLTARLLEFREQQSRAH